MTTNLPKTGTRATATVIVNRARLRGALRAVEEFMCKDETRFHLNGALVEIGHASSHVVRIVATDGHTLARSEVPCTIEGALPDDMIIAADAVRTAIKLLKCAAKLGEQTVALEFGPRSVTLRMWDGASCPLQIIDAKFPPYEQAIPKYTHTNDQKCNFVGVDPSYLARAGDAIAQFGRERGSVAPVTRGT